MNSEVGFWDHHSTEEARYPSNGTSTVEYVWTGSTERPGSTWGGQWCQPAEMIFESTFERKDTFKKNRRRIRFLGNQSVIFLISYPLKNK